MSDPPGHKDEPVPSVAPEVISTRARAYDGQKADIWSAGVMLYVMLFHAYPFERTEDRQLGNERMMKMLERIITVDYQIPSAPEVLT
jgi:serine/threonine-protein kinase SRK2